MKNTPRKVLAAAVSLYSGYKVTYKRYNSPYSTTQRKITEHTRNITSLSARLNSLGTSNPADTPVQGRALEGYPKEVIENDLREKQHKLEFRQSEALHGTDEIVSRSCQFYQNNQETLYRLGIIEAELDGISINQDC